MNPFKVRRFDKRPLPCCGYMVNASAEVTGQGIAPGPGDLTFCTQCGAWLMHTDDDMSLRLLSEQELDDLDRQAHGAMRFASELTRRRASNEGN